MAASRSGSWSSLTTGSLPSGSVTIQSGSNRKFSLILSMEKNGDQTVSTFTIGGQTYDEIKKVYVDSGSEDQTEMVFIWNESTIASMSGTTISFAGISSGAKLSWAYATIQDTDQGSTTANSNSSAAATSVTVTTTSNANDFAIGVMSVEAKNRAPLACDVLTGQLSYNVADYATAVFDDAGGNGSLVFSNDGFSNSIMAALVVVFSEIVSTGGLPGYNASNRGILRGVGRGIG